jgi:hypothetical protein
LITRVGQSREVAEWVAKGGGSKRNKGVLKRAEKVRGLVREVVDPWEWKEARKDKPLLVVTNGPQDKEEWSWIMNEQEHGKIYWWRKGESNAERIRERESGGGIRR